MGTPANTVGPQLEEVCTTLTPTPGVTLDQALADADIALGDGMRMEVDYERNEARLYLYEKEVAHAR